VRASLNRTPGGVFLKMTPQGQREFVAAIRRALDTAPQQGPRVILTQPDIRRYVRALVEQAAPGTWVVSYTELSPEIALEAVGRVMAA
jgi:type III secretory pathway component EscV